MTQRKGQHFWCHGDGSSDNFLRKKDLTKTPSTKKALWGSLFWGSLLTGDDYSTTVHKLPQRPFIIPQRPFIIRNNRSLWLWKQTPLFLRLHSCRYSS